MIIKTVPLKTHKKYKKILILLSLLLTSIFVSLQIGLPSNKLSVSGDVGTQVGGTITSNTTWTAENSPYIITDTIQIPENVNLIIEPGVTITVQSSVNTMFLINGFITAHGNISSKIVFDGNSNSNFFKTNHPVATGFVDLDYCIIRNGMSAFWFDNTGSFNLTNSELINLSQESYLWYPSQDVFIEHNTFTNTSGIKIGTDDYSSNTTGVVWVRYNLFLSNQGYIINNFASYGQSKTFVNNNSFTSTSGVILEVEQTSTTADMDASQNYWGITNTTIIDSMIYDKNDDASCSSYINYLPLLDVPDPDAPIAPTPTPSPTPTPTPSPTPSLPPSPTPTDTQTPITNENPSSTPNPSTVPNATSTPTSAETSDSTSYQTSNQSPNPSTAHAIPEISPLVTIVVLLAGGLIGATVFRKNQKTKCA